MDDGANCPAIGSPQGEPQTGGTHTVRKARDPRDLGLRAWAHGCTLPAPGLLVSLFWPSFLLTNMLAPGNTADTNSQRWAGLGVLKRYLVI